MPKKKKKNQCIVLGSLLASVGARGWVVRPRGFGIGASPWTSGVILALPRFEEPPPFHPSLASASRRGPIRHEMRLVGAKHVLFFLEFLSVSLDYQDVGSNPI